MKKIIYYVVYTDSITGLISEVNTMISDGWLLAGSMCSTEANDSHSFYQPMMKSEEVTDES